VTPKVSIIVPVYNVSRFIERCARSLFEQTFDLIEYIFINDCSPDDSISILKKIVDQYPLRHNMVHIINHATNRGLAAARNTGLSIAKGKYIQHVDSDDFLELNTIELLYNKAVEENADIVVSDFIFDWGKVTKNCSQNFSSDPIEFTKLLLSGEILPGVVNKLIKRSLYFENNILALEGINMGEDYVTTTRLSYFANKISKVEKPLYHYSQINENAYTKCWSQTSIENLITVLNVLNDFFISKPDYEKFKISLLQGQLRKKISLFASSNPKYRNLISTVFTDANAVFHITNLSLHEKIIFRLSYRKLFRFLGIYLHVYSFTIDILQKLKGRK